MVFAQRLFSSLGTQDATIGERIEHRLTKCEAEETS